MVAFDGGRLVRAFVGVRVGEAPGLELALVQRSLERRCPPGSLRLVDPRDFHLTLRFLGDVEPSEAERVIGRLSEMSEAPGFTLCLGGLACLPNLRVPRVVYASVEDPAPLASLARLVVGATGDLGQAEADRPFRAHATLARVRDARRDGPSVGEAVQKSPRPKSVEWPVESLELMATVPAPGGPRYRTVFSRALG